MAYFINKQGFAPGSEMNCDATNYIPKGCVRNVERTPLSYEEAVKSLFSSPPAGEIISAISPDTANISGKIVATKIYTHPIEM